MIEKFISIKNIGRFRDCSPRGDVSFRKLTLLFAENGRGKTTLCAIFRSLKTGLSQYISERQTLGTTDSASGRLYINPYKADVTLPDVLFRLPHAKGCDGKMEWVEGEGLTKILGI